MTERNDLGIDGDSLVVVPRGMDKLWGFRRRVVVPLARITDVAVERNPHRVPMGWRGPGLDAMGKLVGTFHPEKQRHYWNFSGRGNVLTVGIAGGEPFDRLYLSVDDAEAARVLISGALPAAEDSKPQPPAELPAGTTKHQAPSTKRAQREQGRPGRRKGPMPSSDASGAPQRAERLRERVSLLLMLLPLVIALVFVLLTPSVWSTDLAVTFTEDNELAGTAAGWIVAALALGAALLCAWIGAQGTREQWKYNRRWQRGVLAAAAAGLTTVLLSTWAMTEALREGRDPNVGLVLFVTVCALLYGAACAAVTPRDLVDTRYA